MIFYRNWSSVQALSFDLDDTLYFNAPHIRRAEQWLMAYLKAQIDVTAHLTVAQWQHYKRRVLKAEPGLKQDVSACRKAWLSLAFQEHGLGPSEAKRLSEQIFQQFIAVRSDFVVPQDNLVLLQRLAERYRLVAISNGNVDLTRIGLADVFELTLKAGSGLRAKPALDMYQRASRFLQLKPQQIAHVGDHAETDVAGAIKAGYRAIWLNQDGQQPRRLSALPDIEISQLAQLQHLL